MQKFTTKIVNMMKAERLYETQGGPIILSQVGKSSPLGIFQCFNEFLCASSLNPSQSFSYIHNPLD